MKNCIALSLCLSCLNSVAFSNSDQPKVVEISSNPVAGNKLDYSFLRQSCLSAASEAIEKVDDVGDRELFLLDIIRVLVPNNLPFARTCLERIETPFIKCLALIEIAKWGDEKDFVHAKDTILKLDDLHDKADYLTDLLEIDPKGDISYIHAIIETMDNDSNKVGALLIIANVDPNTTLESIKALARDIKDSFEKDLSLQKIAFFESHYDSKAARLTAMDIESSYLRDQFLIWLVSEQVKEDIASALETAALLPAKYTYTKSEALYKIVQEIAIKDRILAKSIVDSIELRDWKIRAQFEIDKRDPEHDFSIDVINALSFESSYASFDFLLAIVDAEPIQDFSEVITIAKQDEKNKKYRLRAIVEVQAKYDPQAAMHTALEINADFVQARAISFVAQNDLLAAIGGAETITNPYLRAQAYINILFVIQDNYIEKNEL